MKKTKKSTKLPVLNLSGRDEGEIVLPGGIFAAKVNLPLMAQAVRVFLSNQRKAFAKTKTRGEVRGSGKKIWRQKGTGRARHKDRYAPIFVGGGVTHGPKGDRNYKKKFSLKMKRASLKSALTVKFEDKSILVIKGFDKFGFKTKPILNALTDRAGLTEDRKFLLVLSNLKGKVKKALRNVPFVTVSSAAGLNTYLVLNHDRLILTPRSVKDLSKRMGENE